MQRAELLAEAERALRRAFPARSADLVRALALKLASPDRRLPPRTCFVCRRENEPPLVQPQEEEFLPQNDPVCIPCLLLISQHADAAQIGPPPTAEMLVAELSRALDAHGGERGEQVLRLIEPIVTETAKRTCAACNAAGAWPLCAACAERYRRWTSCPCCGHATLTERERHEICNVCFWEDDGQDDESADEVWSGPNGTLSLTEARRNFVTIGACEERLLEQVRQPGLREPQLRRYAIEAGRVIRVPIVGPVAP